MGIRIIADSTADLSKEEQKKYNIEVVPLKVIFGDKEYREGVDISIEGFYDKLIKAEKAPTTSQPAPDDFIGLFNEAKQAGDSVIVMCISEKLSGTVQSARIAKDMSGYDSIHIFDSKTTTTGLRILIHEAARMRDEGKGFDEITAAIEELKDRVVLLAMVDTLEYLHKGGRLSKSSAILGTLLKFKPILTLKDGVISVVGKERGINKAMVKILDTMEAFGEIDLNYPVNLGYTSEVSTCLVLKERLSERYGLDSLTMYPVGCVIGTHVGPGACIVTYVKK